MNIVFKSITWKNFLSTGSAGNTIDFQAAPMTLIAGVSGSGKSTLLCALTFALFGKSFRDVNKPNLVNSINQKNCLVEVTFSIGPTEYRVVRGIKPAVFEIYSNGIMLNQNAASRDYQKTLEQQILKLNYKTFTQLVILGSSSYVPFMQLPSAQRREVIEDILDISVFSVMNSLLKDKIAQTKTELADIDNKIRQCRDSAISQQRIIDTLINSKSDQVGQLSTQIQNNQIDIDTNHTRLDVINTQIADLLNDAKSFGSVDEDLKKITRMKSKLSTKKDHIEETIEFFYENETCPACSQLIPHDHRQNIIESAATEKNRYEDDIKTLDDALEAVIKRQREVEEINRKVLELNAEANQLASSNRVLSEQNKKLQSQLFSVNADTGNIDQEKEALKQIAANALHLDDRKKFLLDQKNIQEVTSTLLKDTGIKANIIKEYIPIMNKLINQYLGLMDMFVQFELDENFNEVIRSRHRDVFTYTNFSEGERLRIDLSIMFTWRHISKMKNSVNTNLLIMDEIVDNRLDTKTVELFLQIVRRLENTHVFIISHRDDIVEKFDRTITFTKKNEFSLMEIS